MRLRGPLVKGVLLARRKRFLADVRLGDGREVIAHCPNPGSMATCMGPGWPVWLSHRPEPHRRLSWTWELARDPAPEGGLILVNTAVPNLVVREAIALGRIPQLTGYAEIQAEISYPLGIEGEGGVRSRADLRLSVMDRPPCYIEVKSVTLRSGTREAAFPDSRTVRGRRHLAALGAVVRAGGRAVQLFCVSRTGIDRMRPADEIDPDYGRALREAARVGVELLALTVAIDPLAETVTLTDALPIAL